MAEILQKVNRNEKSICGKCSHRFVCVGINNQPCFECNQFTEEVVRCKDCKHRVDELGCGNYLCNRKMIGMVRPNDFCSFGERE